ncbi:MAG: Maf family protein [Halorhodospira sp.]
MTMTPPAPLILASSSPYRQALLERLGLPFEAIAPAVNEAARAQESPEALAVRLAGDKAAAVAASRPEAVVLGSDQVVALGTEILGKPGTVERARAQLARYSGQEVRFVTAVSVRRGEAEVHEVAPVSVRFRQLDAEAIARYIDTDRPLDCAGGIRSEGLGASLLESVVSHDPTALVGLPLIVVARLLRHMGYRLP